MSEHSPEYAAAHAEMYGALLPVDETLVSPQSRGAYPRKSRAAPKLTGVESMWTTSQVLDLEARISARQLQWWDERGLIRAVQSGYRRYYSRDRVIEVLLMAELRARGVSTQVGLDVLTHFRRFVGRHPKWDEGSGMCLVFAGGRCYFEHLHQVGGLLATESAPGYVINVSLLARRVTQ